MAIAVCPLSHQKFHPSKYEFRIKQTREFNEDTLNTKKYT